MPLEAPVIREVEPGCGGGSAMAAELIPARHTMGVVEGENPFGGLFGDPDDLQRRLAEFAEQMQGAQRVAWADNAIKLAVDLTVAAINRVSLEGDVERQAEQIRSVMAIVFPEA